MSTNQSFAVLAVFLLLVVATICTALSRAKVFPFRGIQPRIDETDPKNYFVGRDTDLLVWVDDPIGLYRERIVAVAQRDLQGVLYWAEAPLRHHNVINNHMAKLGAGGKGNCSPRNQGFISSHGRFVARKQAMVIARHARQVVRQTGSSPDVLYSEDLWI